MERALLWACRTIAVIVNTDNRAPEFKDQSSSLEIDENSADDANVAIVGQISEATDPNDDNLTYKLTGADAGPVQDHQRRCQRPMLTIMPDEEWPDHGEDRRTTLDYEAKNTYMVTVMATDPNGLSDTDDVAIKVGSTWTNPRRS